MSTNPHLKTFSPSPILVDIDDVTIENTVIKRKVLYKQMVYTDPPFDGEANAGPFSPMDGVVLNCRVLLFASAPDGTYGPRLASRIFNDYDVQITADKNTLVDPTTGDVICEASKQFDPVSFQEGGVLYGIDYMTENDFFHQMASLAPVVVREVIAAYLAKQNAAGKFPAI